MREAEVAHVDSVSASSSHEKDRPSAWRRQEGACTS